MFLSKISSNIGKLIRFVRCPITLFLSESKLTEGGKTEEGSQTVPEFPGGMRVKVMVKTCEWSRD